MWADEFTTLGSVRRLHTVYQTQVCVCVCVFVGVNVDGGCMIIVWGEVVACRGDLDLWSYVGLLIIFRILIFGLAV